MKFFKKALIATAIIGSVGAQAATVSSDTLKLSAEGVMYKTPVVEKDLVIDVVVDKTHPSASTITLTFDTNTELDLILGACADGEVQQAVGGGQAHCGNVGFDYGTGSFTFDSLVYVDGDESKGVGDTLSFKVNLGNPLYADSSFRVHLGSHGFDGTTTTKTVLVKGESFVNYRSVKADGTTEIETGSSQIAEEVSQYAYSVKTELDGVIERVNGLAFVNSGSAAKDTFTYNFKNNLGLGLAITGNDTKVTLSGKFDDVTNFATTTATVGTTVWSKSVPTGEYDTATITVSASEHDAAPTSGASAYIVTPTVTVTVDGVTEIPVTGDVDSKAVVIDSAGNNATKSFPTGGIVVASGVDAGAWVLDATIVNVPYFIVNHDVATSFVHFANESKKDADVIVSAIDNHGTVHAPVDLGFDLTANTVTKVSAAKIAELFDIDDMAKLSVTFNIDADEEDIHANAISQNDQGRSEVSHSQFKGKK